MSKGIFTRNYDNVLALLRTPQIRRATYKNYAVGTEFKDGNLTLKDFRGKVHDKIYYYYGASSTGLESPDPLSSFTDRVAYENLNAGETSIFLGSSLEQATYEDINLGTPIKITSAHDNKYDLMFEKPLESELIYNKEKGYWQKTIKYIFTAQRPCIINEYGLYYKSAFTTDQSSSTYIDMLIYREVFDHPYELKTNDRFEMNITVTVPANPNSQPAISSETTVLS